MLLWHSAHLQQYHCHVEGIWLAQWSPLTCQIYATSRCETVRSRAACVDETPTLGGHAAERLNITITQVHPGVGAAPAWQSIAMDPLVGTVDDEEQPQELVEALGEDVLPHAAIDDGLLAAVRLCQQQVRGGRLSCQRCNTKHARMSTPFAGYGCCSCIDTMLYSTLSAESVT